MPLPFFRFELDDAAMRLDELAGQRQPETERGLAPEAGLADAMKAIEHARHVFGGDPRAVVVNRMVASISSPSAFSVIRPLRSV